MSSSCDNTKLIAYCADSKSKSLNESRGQQSSQLPVLVPHTPAQDLLFASQAYMERVFSTKTADKMTHAEDSVVVCDVSAGCL